MAHLVSQMTYIGAVPRHGLGNPLPSKQAIEVWEEATVMDRRIEETPVRFLVENAGVPACLHLFPEQKWHNTAPSLSICGYSLSAGWLLERHTLKSPMRLMNSCLSFTTNAFNSKYEAYQHMAFRVTQGSL